MDGSGIVLNAWGSILWWAIPLLIAWFVFDSAWFKGKVGEWAVNRSFDKHLDPDEYKVLHDVTLPFKGGTTQIDHIVLSQFGVFVVETKKYSGWILGSANNRTWTQTFHRRKFKFQNPLRQNAKHVKAVISQLRLQPEDVRSVVIFTGTAHFKTAMPENVTKRAGGVMYIRRWRTVRFTPEQVTEIQRNLATRRLRPGIKTNKAHIKNLQTAVASPLCPKCEIPLTLRTAKKGARAGTQFWGCKNFPKCRYTKPAA
jgi:hypothetical protein